MDIIASIIAAPFNCVIWVVMGVLAGAFARRIMNRPDQPFINDLILGVIGSFIGGILVTFVGYNRPEGGLAAFCINFVVAIVGACALIAVGSLINGGDRKKKMG